MLFLDRHDLGLNLSCVVERCHLKATIAANPVHVLRVLQVDWGIGTFRAFNLGCALLHRACSNPPLLLCLRGSIRTYMAIPAAVLYMHILWHRPHYFDRMLDHACMSIPAAVLNMHIASTPSFDFDQRRLTFSSECSSAGYSTEHDLPSTILNDHPQPTSNVERFFRWPFREHERTRTSRGAWQQREEVAHRATPAAPGIAADPAPG